MTLKGLSILLAAATIASAITPPTISSAAEFPYSNTEAKEALEQASEIVRDSAVAVLRDGTRLSAEVIRPAGSARYPVILVRTVYGREAAIEAYGGEFWARRGYAFVSQDVRGKGSSEGVFDPWVNEAEDGYDTIEWAAKQPWSNGRVGMLGGSYLGAVQWAAASLNPPSLKAMAVFPAISDPFFGGAYDHGVLSLAPFWAWENGEREQRETPEYDEKLLATLPLSRLDNALFGENSPTWDSYLRRSVRSAWAAPRWPNSLCASKAPALIFSALWDGDVTGPVLNWQARRDCPAPQDALIMGPWGHSMAQTGRRGDVEYGEQSKVNLMRVLGTWFDTHLKDHAPPAAIPRARIFVTGANRWQSFAAWPPVDGKLRTLHLQPPNPTGRLSESRPTKGALIQLSYRPHGITRSFRDAAFSRTTLMPPSAHEGDQVLFVTEPLLEPATLAGSPSLHLSFIPGDSDADLFAFLLDVAPDGTMRVISQPGKSRLSYQENGDHRKLLKKGNLTQVNLRLMDFAHQFEPGHRLGLIVRTEWFPRWARNPGAGRIGETETLRQADHFIVLDPKFQGQLELLELRSQLAAQ